MGLIIKKKRATALIQYIVTKVFGSQYYETVKGVIPEMIEMVIFLSKNEMVINM